MPESKALAQSGAKAIRYRTKDHEYQVSAGSFFQVNRYRVDELVSVVTGNASGDTALDLYAGVGLFSAALAGKFRHIFAVEASHTSHADLIQMPANVKAVGARTGDYLRDSCRKGRAAQKRPDLVVMDPPRAGAGKAVTARWWDSVRGCPICFVRSSDSGSGPGSSSGCWVSH